MKITSKFHTPTVQWFTKKMKKKRQNKKLFHSPITLNIAREDGVIHFDLMAYDENSFSRRESTDWQEVEKFARLNEGKTLWINAYHLENKVALEQLEEFFGI